MDRTHQTRRTLIVVTFLLILSFIIISSLSVTKSPNKSTTNKVGSATAGLANNALGRLDIKGRASKTNYSRSRFGGGWSKLNGCDLRNIILNRDMKNVIVDKKCNVLSGTLLDPYSAKVIHFVRGSKTSNTVQIDHVVALSDAWQKGAQQLTQVERVQLANDPLELLAVGGDENQAKSDGDAATWLPKNKSFRCQYVARQIAVKIKYKLWVTSSEHSAMRTILNRCPGQLLPSP